MFSNLSEIQKLNLKYGNPLLDFTRIILSFQTILKFKTVALCSKYPYYKHHWTDEARILSWGKTWWNFALSYTNIHSKPSISQILYLSRHLNQTLKLFV